MELLDIDLGLTSASNTNAIRRLALTVGEDNGITALWLDSEVWCLKPLYQTYSRTAPTPYDYTSPCRAGAMFEHCVQVRSKKSAFEDPRCVRIARQKADRRALDSEIEPAYRS